VGNLSGTEILVILLVALMLLGPDKLPEAARQIGKWTAEFRRVTSGFQEELRSAVDSVTEPLTSTVNEVRSSLTGALNSTSPSSSNTGAAVPAAMVPGTTLDDSLLPLLPAEGEELPTLVNQKTSGGLHPDQQSAESAALLDHEAAHDALTVVPPNPRPPAVTDPDHGVSFS
jgi:Tat protein translocase TatB subunit